MKGSNQVTALILAGGRGERFWPKSRKEFPKHLLSLYGKESLLVQTIKRLEGLVEAKNIWIITNRKQSALIKQLWKGRFPGQILIEPEGRNTAAAIGLAAIQFKRIYGPETVMLVLSADHWIRKIREFKESLRQAVILTRREKGLVTVGVRAVRPETGFGYIEKGSPSSGLPWAFKVKRFIEKPDLKKAKKIYSSSRYLWNCGIFIWEVEAILSAFRDYLPSHFKALSQIEKIKRRNKRTAWENIYRRMERLSIDYGILEKAKNVWTVEGRFIWRDVGSWSAWAELKKKDISGNIIMGNVLPIDTERSAIWTTQPLVATLGVKDLIIVVDKDAVLVCSQSRTQEVKKIVEKLQQKRKWQRYT